MINDDQRIHLLSQYFVIFVLEMITYYYMLTLLRAALDKKEGLILKQKLNALMVIKANTETSCKSGGVCLHNLLIKSN